MNITVVQVAGAQPYHGARAEVTGRFANLQSERCVLVYVQSERCVLVFVDDSLSCAAAVLCFYSYCI